MGLGLPCIMHVHLRTGGGTVTHNTTKLLAVECYDYMASCHFNLEAPDNDGFPCKMIYYIQDLIAAFPITGDLTILAI